MNKRWRFVKKSNDILSSRQKGEHTRTNRTSLRENKSKRKDIGVSIWRKAVADL